jgi:hypothetical protein
VIKKIIIGKERFCILETGRTLSQAEFSLSYLRLAHPAGSENLHFTLNGEIRRAHGPPVAHAQMAWEDVDQVSFVVPRYSYRQARARAA